MRQPLSRLRVPFSLMFCLVLTGCASTTGPSNAWGYYWQSLRGHMQILHAAEPIDDWVARTDISPALRERLQLAQRARAFAITELGLPDNAVTAAMLKKQSGSKKSAAKKTTAKKKDK